MNLINKKKHYNKGKNNPMWGKYHTKETRRKMSVAGKGRKFAEIHKARISEAMRGKKGLGGADNPMWKGGEKISGGYVLIWKPEHPCSNKAGYIRRSRLVAEEVLGRHLYPWEVVHHKNKDRSDDNEYNLVIFTQSLHRSLHIISDKIIRDRRGRFLPL